MSNGLVVLVALSVHAGWEFARPVRVPAARLALWLPWGVPSSGHKPLSGAFAVRVFFGRRQRQMLLPDPRRSILCSPKCWCSSGRTPRCQSCWACCAAVSASPAPCSAACPLLSGSTEREHGAWLPAGCGWLLHAAGQCDLLPIRQQVGALPACATFCITPLSHGSCRRQTFACPLEPGRPVRPCPKFCSPHGPRSRPEPRWRGTGAAGQQLGPHGAVRSRVPQGGVSAGGAGCGNRRELPHFLPFLPCSFGGREG